MEIKQLKSIKLKNLKDYLINKGWMIEGSNLPNLDKISKIIDKNKIEVLIPANEAVEDYEYRLSSIILMLSNLQNKDMEDILDEILYPKYNSLRVRINSNEENNESLPYDYAEKAISDIKKIIRFQTCSAITPQSQYQRGYDKANKLLEECRLAQTERGSFVIRVLIPELIEENKNKELSKLMINNLITGLLEIRTLDLSDEKRFKKEYDLKLSKNVCDAISNLLGKEDGHEIEIKTRLNGEDKIKERSIKIEPQIFFKKLNKMASYLKKIHEEEIITIEGYIPEMKRDELEPHHKTDKKRIKVYAESKKINIYILLKEEDYKKACDAHKNKKKISITGLLTKIENRWYLEKPKNFQAF